VENELAGPLTGTADINRADFADILPRLCRVTMETILPKLHRIVPLPQIDKLGASKNSSRQVRANLTR
jgi:hypothetical protein